jgi:hypothetical protein
LYLTPFLKHVFKVYSCCSMNPYLIPFSTWIIFQCYAFHSSVAFHLDCNQFLAILSNCYEHLHTSFLCTFVLAVHLVVEFAGLYSDFMLKLLKNCPTVF